MEDPKWGAAGSRPPLPAIVVVRRRGGAKFFVPFLARTHVISILKHTANAFFVHHNTIRLAVIHYFFAFIAEPRLNG